MKRPRITEIILPGQDARFSAIGAMLSGTQDCGALMTHYDQHDAAPADQDLSPAAAFLAEADALWPDVDGFYRFAH